MGLDALKLLILQDFHGNTSKQTEASVGKAFEVRGSSMCAGAESQHEVLRDLLPAVTIAVLKQLTSSQMVTPGPPAVKQSGVPVISDM